MRDLRVFPGPRLGTLCEGSPGGGFTCWDATAQPSINWKHVDGPYVHFRNGEMHWLTWRERWQAWRRKIDAFDLEVKYRPHLAAGGRHFAPGGPGVIQDDKTTVHIVATMKSRWVPHFLGMLAEMQRLGTQGSSRSVTFVADGDGDFRPRFSWWAPSDVRLAQPTHTDPSGNTTYDAG